MFVANVTVTEAERLVGMRIADWRGKKTRRNQIALLVSRDELLTALRGADAPLKWWNRQALHSDSKGVTERRRQVRLAQINGHVRRVRELTAGGNHSDEEWQRLLDENGNRCLCCGESEDLTRDHVVPLAKGGSHEISNIQPLCRRCNSAKGTKSTDYRIGRNAVYAATLTAVG
jgi:5-methylcytosine-specific restriction endonuclease McrA